MWSPKAGECVYSLRLDGRPATTAVQPRLKSESVLEMAVKPWRRPLPALL